MDGYIQKGGAGYWRAISALFLGTLAAFIVMYCTQPLIPVFSKEFGLNPSVASLAMSVTSGGLAVSMFAIATFAGFLDRKKTMAVSLVGSALLALVCAFSDNFWTIVVCRAAQGVLAAGFPAIALAYVNEEFDAHITGLVTGIYISGTSIGGLSSRLLVSTITDFFSWHVALAAVGVVGLAISTWFCLAIPKSRHFTAQKKMPEHLLGDILRNLRDPIILKLYSIAFLLLGSFMAVYNYIGYPLLAPPYNLSQTAVGALFLMYLLGTFSSTFMGALADRFGKGRILCLSIAIMATGALVTLGAPLFMKVGGLAIFTFGFFGSHSTASGWVGRSCRGDKAQASSLYLLFYYAGASVVGTAGGLFLSSYGWAGVVAVAAVMLGIALAVAVRLLVLEARGERRMKQDWQIVS